MKQQVFCQCDKCIGITPCKVLKDGKIVCEYCSDEVKHPNIKRVSSEAEPHYYEQHI